MDAKKKFRFREFPVYKDALSFSLNVRELVQKFFPETEEYSLTRQTLRAVYSIVLNIAEGSDRGTDKDFAYFLNMSHTSLNEVVACFDIAQKFAYIDEVTHSTIIMEAAALANQLTAFRQRLLADSQK